MNSDRKFFLWLLQTEDGILPFDNDSIKGFNNIFADIGEEEARKLKRKWRKVWRKILLQNIPEENQEERQINLDYWAIGIKNVELLACANREFRIRRRNAILYAYHDYINRVFLKKDKSNYLNQNKKGRKRKKK